MPMTIVETTISGLTVKIRLADNTDPAAATEWVELAVLLAPLTLPSSGGDLPLGEPNTRRLAAIQLAALRRARDVIGTETQRLVGLSTA
jgi:hypothetical protein